MKDLDYDNNYIFKELKDYSMNNDFFDSYKKELYFDVLKKYYKKIESSNMDTCANQEDKLFNNIDDVKRIKYELKIIKTALIKDVEMYLLYIDLYNKLVSLLSVSSITKEVIPDIKEIIVLFDLLLDLPVHLYSVIPGMLGKYEEELGNDGKKLS